MTPFTTPGLTDNLSHLTTTLSSLNRAVPYTGAMKPLVANADGVLNAGIFG